MNIYERHQLTLHKKNIADNLRRSVGRDTMIDRWQWIVPSGFFIISAATIYSALLKGAYIYIHISAILPSPTIAVVSCILLVGLLEVTKLAILNATVRPVIYGWVHTPLAKTMVGISALVLLGVLFLDYRIDVAGMPAITQAINERTNIVKIDTTSESKERTIQDNISKAMNTTWKGKVTTEALATTKMFLKHLEHVSEQKNAATIKSVATASNTGMFLTIFAGIGVLLLITFTILIHTYKKAAFDELQHVATTHEQKSPTATDNTKGSASSDDARWAISRLKSMRSVYASRGKDDKVNEINTKISNIKARC